MEMNLVSIRCGRCLVWSFGSQLNFSKNEVKFNTIHIKILEDFRLGWLPLKKTSTLSEHMGMFGEHRVSSNSRSPQEVRNEYTPY